MNLCSHNHEEICYEGHTCPMCALKESHAEEVSEWDRKLDNATDQISELESRLAE